MDAFVRRTSRVAGETAASATEHLERHAKRQKREPAGIEQSDESDGASEENDTSSKRRDGLVPDSLQGLDDSRRGTEIENALPPTGDETQAIQEYEAFRSSQGDDGVQSSNPAEPQSRWVKGKASIYVDAFNLALDTVLDEEASLFNAKELEVFNQWRGLDYESQYLYVRLFLRKTASWHRTSRLGYYDDVSDPELAVKTLQKPRELPEHKLTEDETSSVGIDFEEVHLGDTFTFADCSEDHITTVDEAASLLYLDELKIIAKEAKVQGRNKAELTQALHRMSQQQTGLLALGLSRQNSRDSGVLEESEDVKSSGKARLRRHDSNREQHFLNKILDVVGPCVRLSPSIFNLFERVHLVFYRSTEWTEKSLTTIILAKIARRNFPEYIVCRTSTIFASRQHLVEFEWALKLEAQVDGILEFNGPPGEEGFQKVLDIFDKVYPRWQMMVAEEYEKEQNVYDMGEGSYLRRFNPAHSYTRIIHKALYILGRMKEHKREHALLTELLDQRLFHLARRGAWYQRKALLEEHYMAELDPEAGKVGMEQLKRRWKEVAAATCETGLQDPDCHLIHHYDLQKRLVKLEKRLRIPRRLQHDFGHVRLEEPIQINIEGIQLKRDLQPKPGRNAVSTKTVWLDELDSGGECSVEEMCLSHFRTQGWKGYHAEGGIIRTLFAYLFYDILFLYIPNIFQTAYQTCPLDLHTDSFFPARASEINHRLVEIANGEGERILRQVWDRERERRTSVVGLNWNFDVEDLAELVRCFEGNALAAVCKVMAQEYKARGGGIPDLVLWRVGEAVTTAATATTVTPESNPSGQARGEVMFAEVKSANDRLSDTQRLWIHVLTNAGVRVSLCNAVAKEVREID